ncbi:MAG: outer spore coat protein CotE [Bacilli bacterium]|nr:outer spore coat protein CotE [Bacilli bacterium]
MNEIREIVTKAVVGKGKKIIRLNDVVNANHEAFSILGCWVINHEFEGNLVDGNKISLLGSFEIDVWYAYDNNTKTDIAKKVVNYEEAIKTRQIVKDVSDDAKDIIIRILQQPTCTNAKISDDGLEVEIIFEVIGEIIGETKMLVTVFQSNEIVEPADDDFENEINENFIKTN